MQMAKKDVKSFRVFCEDRKGLCRLSYRLMFQAAKFISLLLHHVDAGGERMFCLATDKETHTVSVRQRRSVTERGNNIRHFIGHCLTLELTLKTKRSVNLIVYQV
jgi:hypothetical protein